jgi:hypothetical protein
MDGAGGKTWVDPPAEAAKPEFGTAGCRRRSATSWSPRRLPKDLPWNHTDEDGNPQGDDRRDAGAKAGQYFMGLKGTLYWIGNDPGNGGGYPFRIHKIVDGAFNGEDFAYNPTCRATTWTRKSREPEPEPEDGRRCSTRGLGQAPRASSWSSSSRARSSS